jgi:ATP-dependent exoDNAse (exonuclease V) alpha subunit
VLTTIIYPIEYLNSIRTSALPLAKLKLKVGCLIMFLRNLKASQGLCNGSQGILTKMTPHVIEIRLISGEHNGKKAFIPHISISPLVKQIAFAMKRRQFPIHLAFPMTINKSQSMDHIGLALCSDFFAHGQLYVALSPCTSNRRVNALFKNNAGMATINIVHPEVLL